MPEADGGILTVGVLTTALREWMEPAFAAIKVSGEVSNLRFQGSGHVYFTLKDAEASLSVVVFKYQAQGLRALLQEGQAVVAEGRLSIYPPRGQYQLVAARVQPAGEGALQIAFARLKAQLAAEGLFAADRKQPLPLAARRIMVVTSPTGAAWQDFTSVLARRGWRGSLRLLPARVQGTEAAAEIATQVGWANTQAWADLIIVMRGGGSLEDLWPFNEEEVVRALAASQIPTVSAVGHEIDTTLSDLVADFRAETPTAAAMRLCQDQEAVRQRLDEAEEVLRAQWEWTRERGHNRLQLLRQRLRAQDPSTQLQRQRELLTHLAGQLDRAMRQQQRELKASLTHVAQRWERLSLNQQAEAARHELHHLERRLNSLNPREALRRGYTILRTRNGRVVSRKGRLRSGQSLVAEFSDGKAAFSVDDATFQDEIVFHSEEKDGTNLEDNVS